VCTLSSTLESRKTDTEFQPLDASPSNKLYDLPICHGKAHKKTGHQNMTQPKIDIHLHKVCAPPPPSHTARSPENTTHTPGRSSNAPQTTCTPFSYNVGRLLKRLRHQPSDTHDMTSIYIRCVHPRAPSHPPRHPGKQTQSSSRSMLQLQTSGVTFLYVMTRHTKKQGTRKRHTRKVTSIYTRCVPSPSPSHTPRSPENTKHTPGRS
jgi:hypothetical protein